MAIGGIDLDVVRCQLALMNQRLGSLEVDLASAQASLILERSDAVKREAAWADYSKPLWAVPAKEVEGKTP
jgi:hypothetical protein